MATTTSGTEALAAGQRVRRPPASCTGPPATHTDITEINDTVEEGHGQHRRVAADRSSTTSRRSHMPLADLDEERPDHADHRAAQGPRHRRRRARSSRWRPSDHEGLDARPRMRIRHMRGSTALAYEAGRRADPRPPSTTSWPATTSMYGVANAEHFQEWAVLTVEKNRSGQRRRRDWSSRSASTRAGSTRTAASSPSSWSTSGSTSSDGSPADPTARTDSSDAGPRRHRAVTGPAARSGLAVVLAPRRCGCGWGRPGRRGPWSWRR